MDKWLGKVKGREMGLFCLFSVAALFLAAFALGTPYQIAEGLIKIVVSRDALITDYFELAGYAPAFFNAATVFGMGVMLVIIQKIPFTGLTLAALFMNAGYAFWGKNPVNILPIVIGTTLYAWSHRARLNRYIYTALFGTCLAPLITELVFLLPYSKGINLLISITAGIFIGFVLPPLSMHTASMHMGYNLFNVGFSGGILAFVIVSVLRAFEMESDSVLIWCSESREVIVLGLYGYFVLTVIFGWIISGEKLGVGKKLLRLMKHPGRAVADFVMMDGAGITLVNMGSIGIVCVTYILLVGGEFSGPVVGSILAAFGFAAFGAHTRNFLPVLAGVFLSTFVTRFEPSTPGIQLAAVFAVGLAPIAGQFGNIAGIIAGFLHAAIVMCTSQMYGGLNLYNNGFSAGWVAIIMVPVMESFMKHFYERKRAK